MASCSGADENSQKNRKNADILRKFMFRNEVMRICLFAFTMYLPNKHTSDFLADVISFTHTFLEHLEEFSKGKMLMIKTGKRRKVKKTKKQTQRNAGGDSDLEPQSNDENDEKEFDPNKPDDDDEGEPGAIEDTFHDAEMDEESDVEENVERQMNFNAEVSIMISYEVITRYMSVLDERNQLSKKPELVQMTASFFRRIVFQLKQTWIFFQMDYMHYFNEFLQKDICNNSLMKGLMENDSYQSRKLKVSQDQLRSIVTTIVGKFIKLYQDNPMTITETLFRY